MLDSNNPQTLNTTKKLSVMSILTSNVRIVNESELSLLWVGCVRVTTDAEWDYDTMVQLIKGVKTTFKRTSILTSQYSWNSKGGRLGLVIWHPDYPLPDFSNLVIPNLTEVMVVVADPNKTTPYTLGMCNETSTIQLVMFSAFMDVVATVGREISKGWLSGFKDFPVPGYEGDVSKKRKISGNLKTPKFGTIKLYDTVGMANSSLDEFMESVGINSPFKKLSNGWDKGNMRKWMIESPQTFFPYCIGDVLYVEETVTKTVEFINNILAETFKDEDGEPLLPKYLEPYASRAEGGIPMSSGSLVSTTFNNWLESTPEINRVLTALLPFTTYQSSENNRKFYHKVVVPLFTGEEMCLPLTEGVPTFYKGKKGSMGFHPLSFNSIPAHLLFHTNSTALFLAVVYGGRCRNEYPKQRVIKSIIDPDLSGCYGSALKYFVLPVGNPRVFACSTSDVHMTTTLGDFMDIYGDDLFPGCWQIVVENPTDSNGEVIPFVHIKNDLVFSKVGITEESIRANLSTSGENDDNIQMAHVDGNMVMFEREVKCAIITKSIWDTLMSDPSEAAKGEWKRVKVVAASYYLKSDRIIDVTEFESTCQSSLNTDGSVKVDGINVVYPFCWYAVPLSGFIGNMLDYRAKLKKQSVKKGDTFDLLQNKIKLFINTTYGCFAAPYFMMGNTILANNITAKARVGVWMMAKALGSVQSITDGGIFSNNTVRHLDPEKWQNKIPSFATLADYEITNKHRSITIGKLFKTDESVSHLTWNTLKEFLHNSKSRDEDENDKMVNKPVVDHVNNFWRHYGLELKFEVEVKQDNTADCAYYSGSGDYLLAGVKPKDDNKLMRISDAPIGSKNPVVPDSYQPKSLQLGTALTVKYRGCNDGYDQLGFKSIHAKPYYAICQLNEDMSDFTESDGSLKTLTTLHDKQISINQYRIRITTMGLMDLTAGDTIVQPYEISLNDNNQPVETVEKLKLRNETKHKADKREAKSGKAKGSRLFVR